MTKLDKDKTLEPSVDGMADEILESEERFRLLSEATFEALIIHHQGTVQLVNKAFSTEFQYSQHEAQGMNIVDLVSVESKYRVLDNIESTENELYQVTAARKDGSTFPAQVHSKVIQFDGHSFRVASLRNLTSFFKAEEAIHRIEKRLIQLIEGLPIAVLLVDREGVPRYANAVFNRLFSVGIRNIGPGCKDGRLSESCRMFVKGTEDLYPYDELPTIKALHGETMTIDDMEILCKDRRVPVEVSSAPVRNATGEITYSVTVFTDITDRREAERSLKEAEEKYRSIFENAVDGIFQSTPEGKFITVNEAMAKLWGYDSPEEMIRSIDDVAQRYVNPWIRHEFKRMLEEQGTLLEFEAQVLRKDESRMWISVTARAVRDHEGNFSYYEGTLKDITERKFIQESLRESEGKYRTLVETSGDTITMLDPEFNILTINRQGVNTFGYDSMGEMIGISAGKLVAREDLARANENGRKVFESGTIRSYELNLKKKDGTLFPAEVSASPVMDASGKPASLVIIIRDTTQRKIYEEKLRKINAELEGYAHTVSHDLEGPSSAIILASDTLQLLLDMPASPKVEADIRQVVDTIGKNARRTSHLIRGLLDLAEAGQQPRIVSEVSIQEIIGSIEKERASEIEEKGISIDIKNDLGVIMASQFHIYELFSNLLSNAIKHNSNPEPIIEISSIRDDNRTVHRYLIKDNGPGIPDSLLDKLFLPFSKGSGGQTGIGLAIVDKIVKVYRGTVSAYNDNGACFEVAIQDMDPGRLNNPDAGLS
ncbi:MAG: PAS domain S-box protein [Actinobacteria bacterium]|nr:PAS domain S-box protein [Actinomycetota bacterium]